MLSRMSSLNILRNASKRLSRNMRQDEYIRALSFYNNSNSLDKFTPVKTILHRSSIQLPKATLGFLLSSTVNQCRRASSSTDHVRLWQIERLTSAVLPVLLPASFILESPIVDSLLAVLVVMHTHWGLEAIVVDYARPIVVGTIVPKVLHLLLNLLSIVTLAGLLVLVYNGPGIAKTVKNVWAIGKVENSDQK